MRDEQVQPSKGSPRSKKLTVLGFLILALQIGMLFAYGFAGKFSYFASNVYTSYQTLTLPIYFYMSMFAVGLGLMLSYFGKGSALGLGTAIFAIALNIQLSPLLQKFWFNVFIGEFNRTAPSGDTDIYVAYQEQVGVYISVISERSTIAMTISYLISCLAFIGRADLFQTFISLILYNIMWPIPLYCNLRLWERGFDQPRLVFDDFGLTYIYTFAAFFGIVYSIFLNRKYDQSKANTAPSKTSVIYSILGTTIVFCTQPAIALLFPVSSTNPSANRYNVGVLNMYFSQITAMISCIAFSFLFSGFKRINVVSVIVSVLTGPAIVAEYVSLDPNISAYLTVGAFGGILAAFWTQIIHPRLNRKKIEDALSLVGGVLLPSLFGGIVVAPILYRIYVDNARTTLAGTFTTAEYIRYTFIYYFITVGAAIVCAIIAGLFSFCTRSLNSDFTIRKMFSPDYGLCDNPVKGEQNQRRSEDSAENFKK